MINFCNCNCGVHQTRECDIKRICLISIIADNEGSAAINNRFNLNCMPSRLVCQTGCINVETIKLQSSQVGWLHTIFKGVSNIRDLLWVYILLA